MIILALCLGSAGCSTDLLDRQSIVTITLECADFCKTMNNAPFAAEKIISYENADELRIFRRAIETAVKMSGELEYGVMFYMYLSMEDGTQKKFVLNVGDEEDQTGLLVDTAASGQGYEIPEDQTAKLREIIYEG